MTRTIAQRDLRNDNAAIMSQVAAGATFLVTRNGVPVAELRPVAAPRRQTIPGTEWVQAIATGPRIDARAFREDLDRVIDQFR